MLLAVTVLCLAGFPNPHPHVIRDEADAISTAYTAWMKSIDQVTNPRELKMWREIYTARREGNVWHLFPRPSGARYRGQGTHIELNAQTGCVTSSVSFD